MSPDAETDQQSDPGDHARDQMPPFQLPQDTKSFSADAELAELLSAYFVAKSSHDLEGVMRHYSRDVTTFTDAIMGWAINGYDAVEKSYEEVMGQFGDGRSYPTAIRGFMKDGNGSAVMEVTNTPEIVGSELHMISSVDLREGKIVRWVDYWDSVSFDDGIYEEKRAPNDQFPETYLEDQVGRCNTPSSATAGSRLSALLSDGDSEGAANLFDYDGIFEDRAARVQIVGRSEIGSYLERVLQIAPFGFGSKVRHIVGGEDGGGLEWIAGPHTPVRDGITSLAFGDGGLIKTATTVYDSRQLGEDGRAALVLRSAGA